MTKPHICKIKATRESPKPFQNRSSELNLQTANIWKTNTIFLYLFDSYCGLMYQKYHTA